MYKKIFTWLTILIFSWTLTSCTDTIDSVQAFNSEDKPPLPNVENITEVAPPELIQELNRNFAYTQPQVKIISPKNDQTLDSTTAEIKLDVQGITLFKDEELQMGPHLHFFLDDQPYKAIYNVDEPVILSDLAPGTHTIRVFASRPWHESFKNEGAYAQTTFNIFTKTENNNPSTNLPLLTYSRPQSNYGAEPIMLDFYLTNAPLHLAAQENQDDNIADWRIRVTVNGESFLLDTWQPIYLKGFNKGQNWIKLEFIDENGEVVNNVFNSTVRAINYDPKIKDTLSKLVRGKISLAKAQKITNPNLPEEITEETIIQDVEIIEPEITNEIQENEVKTETKVENIEQKEDTQIIKPEINNTEKTDLKVLEDNLESMEKNLKSMEENLDKSIEEIEEIKIDKTKLIPSTENHKDEI
jgi:hypothetical protein